MINDDYDGAVRMAVELLAARRGVTLEDAEAMLMDVKAVLQASGFFVIRPPG